MPGTKLAGECCSTAMLHDCTYLPLFSQSARTYTLDDPQGWTIQVCVLFHHKPVLVCVAHGSYWDLPNKCILRKLDMTTQRWRQPKFGPKLAAPIHGGVVAVVTCVEYSPTSLMAVGFADGTVEVRAPALVVTEPAFSCGCSCVGVLMWHRCFSSCPVTGFCAYMGPAAVTRQRTCCPRTPLPQGPLSRARTRQ